MPDSAPPSLVADIGGTNTRVALADGARVRPQTIRRYRNGDHAGLAGLLSAYLAEETQAAPSGACVAVAGPVRDGAARMTNLDWRIDEDELARAAATPRVALLNDLQAQGHALDHLGADSLAPILRGAGAPPPEAARLVIGLGTGFNAAPVLARPEGSLVTASECGHVTLPVRHAEELALADWLRARHGFAAVEDVLSGRGLERLDWWCAISAEDAGETSKTRAAAAIMAALADGEERATRAARIFARLLGRVAGDLALIHLPFGGVYLAGGVSRAFAPYLHRLGFADAFRDKGRFDSFMDGFAVTLITDDYAALTGCAGYLDARRSAAGLP